MARLKMDGFGTAISGTSGNVVYADTPYGTVIRSRPAVNNPNTLAQSQQRYAFTRAQSEYRTLSRTENAVWKQYALSPLSDDPDTGQLGGRTAYTAFLSLATRYIALHPQGTPPRMPPKYPCARDRIDFNLSLAPGTITVTATAPNSAETRTVVQWIAFDFPSQAYQVRQMRVVAVHRFTADLTLTLEAAPGWYALATHFVSMETGRHTARVEYEPFEVTT